MKKIKKVVRVSAKKYRLSLNKEELELLDMVLGNFHTTLMYDKEYRDLFGPEKLTKTRILEKELHGRIQKLLGVGSVKEHSSNEPPSWTRKN